MNRSDYDTALMRLFDFIRKNWMYVCIAYHAGAAADCECVVLKLVFWADTLIGISKFCPKNYEALIT